MGKRNNKVLKRYMDRDTGINDFSDSVKIYYQDLKNYNPIPKKKEKELIIKAKAGDIEARNKIITANLRFVFEIAKKYRGKGVEISDLISEGNKAMFRAIDKFDVTQDVKFYSYAVWWIRQHMDALVKERTLACEREECFDDVFGGDKINFDNVYSINEDDEDEPSRDIEAQNFNQIEFNENMDQKKFVVKKLLNKLNNRERIVITKYFGIENNDEGQKLEEIGKELNICTERVRQIKVKAINELRAEVFDIKEAEFLFR